ncbi:glycosyltransferase family 2 protein [Mycolicibacterium sp.]|uniref:glycosyltransferase family 2 protein n=1 Tax=Mycolicibacterium sp. TaxID=2320850 RepID=UPI003D0B321E
MSLCVPAYQAERHLGTTLESLLAQRYTDFEIVVVDNHSTDGTAELLASFDDSRIRVVRNEKTLSMVDNFNLAVNLCRGPLVKLVCADDIVDEHGIAAQAAVLQRHPDIALVGVQTDFVDDHGTLLRPARGLRGITGRHSADEVVRRIVRSGTNPIGAPVAAMFRRADFLRVGGFRDELLFVSDTDLWVRLLSHGDFYGIPRALASFRIGSISASAATAARSQLGQQTALVRKLSADPRWGITRRDRLIGRLNAYDKQLRRIGLFQLAKMLDARRRRR